MPVNVCPSPPSGERFTQRNAPLGRRSISHTASGAPLGSHHCATCSALVQASKTRARGASKRRVITIWRPPGVATVTDPMFFTGISPLLSMWCVFRLHLFQVPIQAGKFLLPELSEGLNPFGNILQRDRHECTG